MMGREHAFLAENPGPISLCLAVPQKTGASMEMHPEVGSAEAG